MEYFLGKEYDFSEAKAVASLPLEYNLKVELIMSSVKERKSTPALSLTTGGSITSEPLVMDGVVYITSCDHNMYAVDLESGEEMWRFSTQAPNVSGVMTDGKMLYFDSYDGNLYALRKDGSLVWKFSVGDKIVARPLIHRGRIYFGGKDGNIYAVDMDGKLLWKFATEGPIAATPNAHGDMIYAGSLDYNIYALDINGNLVWKFSTGGETGRPLISKGMIYFGSFDKCLYALDLKGRFRWRFMTDDAFDAGSGFAVVGDTVYFGSKDHCMYAIRNGRFLWKFQTGNMIFSDPIVEEGVVYFGSVDGNLYALDAETGRERWRFSAGGPALFPVKSGDIIVFGCYDCNLYAVRAPGKLLWKFHTSLDYPSGIEPEIEFEHSFVITATPVKKKGKREAHEKEKQISDYGEFKATYTGDSMRDYLGSSIDETGLSMVYKRKKDVYK